MRLREMLLLIDETMPMINTIQFVENPQTNSYTIKNIKKIYNHLRNFAEIEILKNDIDLLLSEHTYLISEENFVNLEKTIFLDCRAKLNTIKSKCTMVKGLLTQIVQPQNENTISFRLYEFEDFNEFTNFCEDLNNKILVPLRRLNIDIQLGELEIGSKWISIVFKIGLGVMLFTAIVRQTFDILIYDYQELRVAKAVTESLELGNEILDEYNKKIIKRMEAIKLEKADQIINEIKEADGFNLKDNGELSELRVAIKFSMDSLEKHIDKGLEVYQALNLKNDERYKLPDFTKLLELKKPQKLLKDNIERDT